LFVHPSKNPGKKVNWRHNIQQNYIQQNDTEYNDIQQILNIVQPLKEKNIDRSAEYIIKVNLQWHFVECHSAKCSSTGCRGAG
jgi:hypothetical protein